MPSQPITPDKLSPVDDCADCPRQITSPLSRPRRCSASEMRRIEIQCASISFFASIQTATNRTRSSLPRTSRRI